MAIQKGFTLIELLVVISIIGTLSSTALVSMKGVRERARDARRVQDLEQLQRALELYYSDHNRYPEYFQNGFPTSGEPYCGGGLAAYTGGGPQGCWNDLATRLSPYVQLPIDPLGSLTSPYAYWYGGLPEGQGYILLMRPEGAVPDYEDPCFPSGPTYYCVGVNYGSF